MKEDLYLTLIHKNLSGDITKEEKSQLNQWLQLSPDNQTIADHIKKTWEVSGDFSENLDIDMEADFKQLQKKISTPSKASSKTTTSSEAKERSLQPRRQWLSIAAGLLLLVVAGFLLRHYIGGEVEILVATTGQKEIKTLTLSDGSKVTLNGNTTFKYPANFKGEKRTVEINGEAFFDVASDASKPFFIISPSSEVTVLGTKFSLNDYKSKPNAVVSVVEGKVQIQPKGKSKKLVLTAEEKGVYQKSFHKLFKDETFDPNLLAWHTKKLIFKETKLEEVIGQLLAYYGKQVYVSEAEILKCTFTGTFENKEFDVVLNAIVGVFGFEVSNVRNISYRLEGGSCN